MDGAVVTLVSYLLVTYKSKETIAAALRSVQAQSGNFAREIVVVDNFAAERIAEIVNATAPGAKVIVNANNLGYTHATNQATAAATGNFLFFLNPDVELAPDCTSNLLAVFAEGSDIAAAAPRLISHNGSTQPSIRNFPRFSTLICEHLLLARLFPRSRVLGHWRCRWFDYEHAADVEQPMASAFLLRAEAARRVGDWDERFFVYFSDVDYCKRIREASWRIRYQPRAEARHLLGGSTRQEGAWIIADAHRGFYRYLAKHELRGWRRVLRPGAALILSLSALMRMARRTIARDTSS